MAASAAIAVSVAATLIFFHRAVLAGAIFVSRDILLVYYPLHRYWAARVGQGEFPQWYPYDGLGQPFAGMVVSGAFHPMNLVYLVLPLGVALTLNVLVCFPVAFLGARALARRLGVDSADALLAAVLYAFGGYLICITNNLAYLMAAATVPWALWAVDRFVGNASVLRATLAATLLASVLFAGDPQSFLVACALGLVVAAARHRGQQALHEMGCVAGLLALTAAVAAVQILPALAASSETMLANQNLAGVQAWSLHPLHLLDVALGPLFAAESEDVADIAINRGLLQLQRNIPWVDSLHLGLPALVLAAGGLLAHRRERKAWLVAASVVTLALLALGKHAGLYAVAFRVVPGWSAFRYPMKLFPFVSLGLALGAAVGMAAIRNDDRRRERTAAALAVLAMVCALLSVQERWLGLFAHHLAPALWSVDRWSGPPTTTALARLGAAFTSRALEAAFACLLVSVTLAMVQRAGLRAGLVTGIVFLHLLVVNQPFYEVASSSVLTRPGDFVTAIRAAEGPARFGAARVYRLRAEYGKDYERAPELAGLDPTARWARTVITGLEAVTPALWGLEGANRYLPAASGRVAAVMADPQDFATRLAPLFDTRYLSLSEDDVREMFQGDRDVVAAHPALGLFLVRRESAGRAYLARPRCVRDRPAALAVVAADDFPKAGEAVVECTHPLPVAPSELAALGQVSVTAYRPERVEIDATAAADAVLVLNDAFYAGWTVRVDGQPAELLAANHAVRGVALPPGTHRVVFSYSTPGLLPGAGLSGATMCGALLLGAATRKRG